MNTDHDFQRRIELLEQRNRLLFAMAGAALCLLAAVACTSLTADAAGDTITTRRLQIVDEHGKTMLELGRIADDYGLVIRDPTGAVRVSLRHNDEETGLFVNDGDGDTRAGVAHFAHGGSGVALHGPGSRGGAVLYFRNQGSLSFYDPDGVVGYRVPE